MHRSRPRFVLASASPARRRLLADAGIDADVVISGVDESTVDSPDPGVLCLELARLKADAVAATLTPDAAAATLADPARMADPTLVLGCDSVLAFGGESLGKPADPEQARARWYRMRGHSGVLYTGHCLISTGDGKRAESVAATTVHVADLTDAEVAAYVDSGEPLRVAGAFTIDGLGAPFVASVEGDPGTVIGLSLPLLRRLLAEVGVEITALWRVGTVEP